MQTDLLEQISAINPLPEDLPAPPLASLPTLPERDAGKRPARVIARRIALALPIAAVVLGLVLLGRGGGEQFDVAAAVYKATIAGDGVHYMLLEGEEGPNRVRYQRWRAVDPVRERDLITGPSGTTELVSGGGVESAWSSAHPRTVLRARSSAPLLNEWDPVRVIQQAYRAGRLHVLWKTTIDGRAAYRTEASSPHGGKAGPIVIVDAHTYMPIEMIYGKPGGGTPTLVLHVRSYRELPATKASLAMLRLAHHTGARVEGVARR